MSEYSSEEFPGVKNSKAFAFSVAEVAEITGLSRSTIYLAVQTGELLGRKRGRRTLVLPKDLETFLENLPSTN